MFLLLLFARVFILVRHSHPPYRTRKYNEHPHPSSRQPPQRPPKPRNAQDPQLRPQDLTTRSVTWPVAASSSPGVGHLPIPPEATTLSPQTHLHGRLVSHGWQMSLLSPARTALAGLPGRVCGRPRAPRAPHSALQGALTRSQHQHRSCPLPAPHTRTGRELPRAPGSCSPGLPVFLPHRRAENYISQQASK